jgi:hypothetical protein
MVNVSDNNYTNQREVEKLVRQNIEKKLKELEKTPRDTDQNKLLRIGFSEKGAARFTHFKHSDGTHFSLMSWVNPFLDKMFGPEADISGSNFPFRGDTFDNLPFDHLYNPREEGKTILQIINFTLPDKESKWISEETTKAREKKEKKGDLHNKIVLVNILGFDSSTQYFKLF